MPQIFVLILSFFNFDSVKKKSDFSLFVFIHCLQTLIENRKLSFEKTEWAAWPWPSGQDILSWDQSSIKTKTKTKERWKSKLWKSFWTPVTLWTRINVKWNTSWKSVVCVIKYQEFWREDKVTEWLIASFSKWKDRRLSWETKNHSSHSRSGGSRS